MTSGSFQIPNEHSKHRDVSSQKTGSPRERSNIAGVISTRADQGDGSLTICVSRGLSNKASHMPAELWGLGRTTNLGKVVPVVLPSGPCSQDQSLLTTCFLPARPEHPNTEKVFTQTSETFILSASTPNSAGQRARK